MDYNNQNPYEQNGGASPYSQNSGPSPYNQNGGTSPYIQNADGQGQSPFDQGSAQGQNPYGQSGTQQTQAGQGDYSQGTQDSGQNPYYQPNPYQQNPYQQNSYQQNGYMQNGYQQSPYQNYQSNQYGGDWEEPMSVKEWLIVLLLMMIPCVNIILMFVWAFSSGEKKSKSNYFKASLIFMGCILAFYFLLVMIAVMAGVATAFY